jgi:diguanylate cyclase (GGDEF)-like protein/PAS domain S-box-containing protein
VTTTDAYPITPAKFMTMEKKLTNNQNTDFSNVFSTHSFEAVFIFNSELKCLDANESALKLFQYNREDFIGSDVSFLIAPDNIQTAIDKASSKSTEPYILKLTRKDGSEFEALVQGSNITISGHELRITTVRDLTGVKVLEQERSSSSAKLSSIYANRLAGIVVIDYTRRIKQANDKAAEIIGYSCAEEIINIHLDELHVSDEKKKKFNLIYYSTLTPGSDLSDELEVYRKDGSRAWLRISGSPLSTASPPDLSEGIVWIIHDISDLKAAERKLEEAFRELEVIFNYANVGIMVTVGDRVIKKTNQTFVDMFGGGSPNYWIGRSTKVMHTNLEAFFLFGAQYHALLTDEDVREVDYQFKTLNGETLWTSISGRAIDSGQPADLTKGVIWVVKDITERKNIEQQLIKLTREDPLTKVSNRRHFVEQAKREINIMRRYNNVLSLLMLDIDFFKKINDNYGHSVGDKALTCFATLCKNSVREIDLVGRLGGEEFAILLLDTPLQPAIEIAQRILNDLSHDDFQLPVKSMTASIGAVEIDPQETLEQALARADKLLYKAKRQGKNRVES